MKMHMPVRHESRICFAIDWFQNEVEAEAYSRAIKVRGDTYNGGFFDGMPCGRDPSFDYYDPEYGQLYAVTTG